MATVLPAGTRIETPSMIVVRFAPRSSATTAALSEEEGLRSG
eukprot:CAMPEP_0185846948 /NCGR_PEP_ID=MMETSP1354-20130828/2405_1 /TAXON_ID=708628 /ORGANISM="Erythrolobus madagascarensis, Strain CCMP3276" /LENGTH=41 /DNA_ID= /DNA_START= /DNA_END= /DNA_ORIENTATION=